MFVKQCLNVFKDYTTFFIVQEIENVYQTVFWAAGRYNIFNIILLECLPNSVWKLLRNIQLSLLSIKSEMFPKQVFLNSSQTIYLIRCFWNVCQTVFENYNFVYWAANQNCLPKNVLTFGQQADCLCITRTLHSFLTIEFWNFLQNK